MSDAIFTNTSYIFHPVVQYPKAIDCVVITRRVASSLGRKRGINNMLTKQAFIWLFMTMKDQLLGLIKQIPLWKVTSYGEVANQLDIQCGIQTNGWMVGKVLSGMSGKEQQEFSLAAYYHQRRLYFCTQAWWEGISADWITQSRVSWGKRWDRRYEKVLILF